MRQQQIDFSEGFKWNTLVHRKVGEVQWPNPNLDGFYRPKGAVADRSYFSPPLVKQ